MQSFPTPIPESCPRPAGAPAVARRARPLRLTVLAMLAPVVSACSGGDAAAEGVWEASVDTIADTVVVRTTAGSVWPGTMVLVPEVEIGVLEGADEYMLGRVASLGAGTDGSIYVMDGQGPHLRVYGPDGTYRATFGRPGEGPGELGGPDGGLAVLSDGRILVRDPGNARIQVYGPDGEPLDTWTIPGTFRTTTPLWRDTADHVYTQVLMDPEADLADWRMGLVRLRPDGTPLDTLAVPETEYEPPFLEARFESGENFSVSRTSLPFSAGEEWALHPQGYFVHGIATDYRISLLRSPAEHGALPLRIERDWEPVPVEGGEAREERARVVRNMRGTEPNWSWDGPGIPEAKPPFRDIFVGRNGRIWVQTSAPGERVEDRAYDPADEESVPDAWREGVEFDVFEPDGRYLGHVVAPDGFQARPVPVFDGDRVWSVVEDELGVQRVVRWRVAAEADGAGG